MKNSYTHLQQNGDYYIYVYACPGASRNLIGKIFLDENGVYYLRVYVNTPPTNGNANKAIHALLSRYLNIRPKNLSILSGHLSQKKIWKYCLK